MFSLQFQRFQQVTLTHLQNIANNYNVYHNMDVRFQSLVEQSQAVALAMNQSQAAIQGDVAHLKTWYRKSQRRSQKVDARLQALDLSLSTKSRQWVEKEGEQKAGLGCLFHLGRVIGAQPVLTACIPKNHGQVEAALVISCTLVLAAAQRTLICGHCQLPGQKQDIKQTGTGRNPPYGASW